MNDWSDILLLVEAARTQRLALDWELLGDYLRLFNLADKLPGLKSIHGATD